jgi:hypothetical protein
MGSENWTLSDLNGNRLRLEELKKRLEELDKNESSS